MRITNFRLGLILLLVGIVLTRVTAQYAMRGTNATPEQVWHSMSLAPKLIVFFGFGCFVAGCYKLLVSAVERLQSRKA